MPLENEKKFKFAQIVSMTGETYTFEEPEEAFYEPETEMFVFKDGDDTTEFPRECVLAFRTVLKGDNDIQTPGDVIPFRG